MRSFVRWWDAPARSRALLVVAIPVIRRIDIPLVAFRPALVVRLGLHEFWNLVDAVFRSVDFIQVVHAPGELRGYRTLRAPLLLLEVAFRALLAFGWRRRTKVPLASAGFARPSWTSAETTGTWTTKTAGAWRSTWPAWAWSTVAAAGSTTRSPRTRPTVTATPAGPRPTITAPRARRSAGSAIFSRARFADGERTAHEQLTIELLDRSLGRRAVCVFHERKPPGATRLAVERPDDLRGFPDGREMDPQVFFGGLVREITYEQSNGWHGVVEGGKSAVGPLLRSITKTLKRAKLGFQRFQLEPEHLAVGRPASGLQLRLRLCHGQLQQGPALGLSAFVWSQVWPPLLSGARIVLLRFDGLAFPSPRHLATVAHIYQVTGRLDDFRLHWLNGRLGDFDWVMGDGGGRLLPNHAITQCNHALSQSPNHPM